MQLTHIIRTLILQSLLNLDPCVAASKSSAQPLPEELLELITILSLKLSNPNLSPSVIQTLETSEILALLPRYTRKINDLISRHLNNQSISLVRITNPTSNASFLHRSIPKLAVTVQTLQQTIVFKKEKLEKERVRLVSEACKVLEKYRHATELVIRILEQNKHGQASRAVKAKVDWTAVNAEQEALTMRTMATKANTMVYNAETKEALRNYMMHLKDSKSRLRQKKRDVEKELWAYGVGRDKDDGGRKEVVMREVARVYVELGKEVEEVKRDLRRLDGS